MTLLLDLGMTLKEEIRYLSLSGIKVLITVQILYAPSLHLLATIVKIVKKANRWAEESEMRETVNVYPMVEETITEYLRREAWNA